jgi:hypothetical protein
VLEAYETQAEFTAAIAARLPAADGEVPDALLDGVAGALLDGIAGAEETLQRERAEPRGAGYELRLRRWVLRDDDAPYFETMGAVISVSATLIAGGLTVQGVVAAASTIGAATWKVWRKGGRLTAEQMRLLTELENRGPLKEDELQQILGGDPEPILADLRDVELRDGSSAALVKRTGDGRWRSVGV